jgi:CO/xanthine dehydrogenase Mo-binding subunit
MYRLSGIVEAVLPPPRAPRRASTRSGMTRLVGERVACEDATSQVAPSLWMMSTPGGCSTSLSGSDHAHARLQCGLGRASPGVVAVATARELGDYWASPSRLRRPSRISLARRQVPLVRDKVRHLGESIAMVVAESRYIAEDAVSDIVSTWSRSCGDDLEVRSLRARRASMNNSTQCRGT